MDNNAKISGKKKENSRERAKGFGIIKKNISEVVKIANILKSSIGPLGMDKVIFEKDGNIIITNDGATILAKIDIETAIGSMIVDLSKSQDDEIGDGTTGIVILAGALLEQAEKLIDKGVHPTRIIEGFEHGCDICLTHLENISEYMNKNFDIYESLLAAGSTAMNSKIINRSKKRLTEICIKAVLAVSDISRRDVNLDLIKIEGKIGGNLENTTLINGIVIDKEFSHTQMPKQLDDVRLCILTSPLEPPKPKTKHRIEIGNIRELNNLECLEQKYFHDMILQIKNSGTNLLLCQWGFDDEGNHLLLRNKLSAVRWVSGSEIELLAVATGAQIVPRFNEITTATLGFASRIRESCFGTMEDRILIVENCSKSKAVTVFIRGSSDLVINEAKRAIRDGVCVIRNLIKDNRIVFGGGSSELSCSLKICDESKNSSGLKHFILNGFSEALKIVPLILAENAGYSSIETIYQITNKQINEKNAVFGVDCTGKVVGNMKEQKVFETLLSKQQQIQMSVQIASAVLRIDDIIEVEKQNQ
nr:T-complex protein1, epsilon-SU [Cryptomonas sp.]